MESLQPNPPLHSDTFASQPPQQPVFFSTSETLAYPCQPPLSPLPPPPVDEPPSADPNPPQPPHETLDPPDHTAQQPQLFSVNNDISSPSQTLATSADPNLSAPSESDLPNLNSFGEGPNDDQNQKQLVQMPLLSENGGGGSGGEEETTSKRRRRSRWDPPADGEAQNGDAGGGAKKRKSRWADDEPKPVFQLPDFMKDLAGGMDMDPEIQALNARLLEISRMLQSGMPLDDRPEGARSPSPEPIYDNIGIRINTREYRARERLNRERQDIITQILKRNPAFKPPADYRPPKLQKKLYIPMKEYPGYNFIGLIIGPRGNTQKRMEKETGAKIVIRGKGSIKEGRLGQKRDLKFDPAENEDLHVLVEAENQESLDAAAGMVEKLLQPVDEVLNEHKRQQLRELAALNGTIKEDEFCRLCGEAGHRQYACPSRMSTFKSDVLCKICGDGGHPTIDCPVKGTVGKKMDDEYQNFLAELGGTVPESLTKQNPALPIMGPNGSGSNPPWVSNNGAGGIGGNPLHPGLGSNLTKIGKEIDDSNLYIGYLPPTLDDGALISLFSSFGEIAMAKVVKDRLTGLSKGYGFVKYHDVAHANQAIASMNGYRLEGRVIAVRVAGKPPQPAVPARPPAPPMSTYPPPNQMVGGYASQQNAPAGSFGTMPPGSYMSTPVPWGAPAPPPFAPYPPMLAGSNMYVPVQGQPMPPYNLPYPPPPQAPVSGVLSQSMSSAEAQQNYIPGMQSQSNASADSAHSGGSNNYGNSMSGMPPNSQPMYQPSSLGYPAYYAPPPPHAPPPPPPVSHATADQQNFGSGPWASTPPAPPPQPISSAEQGQQSSYGADPEYEKFMAEMK